MRVLLAGIAIGVMSTAPALADRKIVQMTPLFVKESAGCETSASGLSKIATGAAALLADRPDDEQLEEDAKQLAAGVEQLRAYCADVASMVQFLKDNAKSSYKSVEKEIDARDNKIRKQRKEAKKLIADLSPVTKRIIPLIAQRKASAPPPEKLTAAKFPSGRDVQLPALSGTWKLSGTANTDTADYTDKISTISASVSARAKIGSSCDKVRIVLEQTAGIEGLVDAEIPSSAKELGVTWRITYTRREKAGGARLYNEMCVDKGDGYRVSAFVIPTTSTALSEKLLALMTRMLAAQLPKS